MANVLSGKEPPDLTANLSKPIFPASICNHQEQMKPRGAKTHVHSAKANVFYQICVFFVFLPSLNE